MNLEYALEIKLGGGQVVEDGEEVPKSGSFGPASKQSKN
jgi:hypothetical protein